MLSPRHGVGASPSSARSGPGSAIDIPVVSVNTVTGAHAETSETEHRSHRVAVNTVAGSKLRSAFVEGRRAWTKGPSTFRNPDVAAQRVRAKVVGAARLPERLSSVVHKRTRTRAGHPFSVSAPCRVEDQLLERTCRAPSRQRRRRGRALRGLRRELSCNRPRPAQCVRSHATSLAQRATFPEPRCPAAASIRGRALSVRTPGACARRRVRRCGGCRRGGFALRIRDSAR